MSNSGSSNSSSKKGRKSNSPVTPLEVDQRSSNIIPELEDYDDNSESFASLFSESRISTPTKSKSKTKKNLSVKTRPNNTLPRTSTDPAIPTLSVPAHGSNRSFQFPRKCKIFLPPTETTWSGTYYFPSTPCVHNVTIFVFLF